MNAAERLVACHRNNGDIQQKKTEIFRIHDGNMPQEQRQYAVETTDYSTRILRVVPSLMRTTLTPGVYPLMRRPSVVWRDYMVPLPDVKMVTCARRPLRNS